MADSNARIARREKVPIPVQDYYSVDEVAALLRISRNRVYDLAKERVKLARGGAVASPRACGRHRR